MTRLNVVEGFIRMCEDGWLQGWHERNGGNLTYRLTKEEVEQCGNFANKTPGDWIELGLQAENLSGEWFLTTGSGKFFRHVSREPEKNIGIVEINETGAAYRMRWGLVGGARPTSELPSHLLNHSVRVEATSGRDRVIYHAHPANIIALTFILPLTARDFTRLLWQSATECPIVFPNGVGVVGWMTPGALEIAYATSEEMRAFDAVVWAHHGLFCAGSDFDLTFGLMHTIEKAAEIAVLVLAAGQGNIRQTITDENLIAAAKAFNVDLNPAFIN